MARLHEHCSENEWVLRSRKRTSSVQVLQLFRLWTYVQKEEEKKGGNGSEWASRELAYYTWELTVSECKWRSCLVTRSLQQLITRWPKELAFSSSSVHSLTLYLFVFFSTPRLQRVEGRQGLPALGFLFLFFCCCFFSKAAFTTSAAFSFCETADTLLTWFVLQFNMYLYRGCIHVLFETRRREPFLKRKPRQQRKRSSAWALLLIRLLTSRVSRVCLSPAFSSLSLSLPLLSLCLTLCLTRSIFFKILLLLFCKQRLTSSSLNPSLPSVVQRLLYLLFLSRTLLSALNSFSLSVFQPVVVAICLLLWKKCATKTKPDASLFATATH